MTSDPLKNHIDDWFDQGEKIKKLLENKARKKAIIVDAYMNGEIEDKQYIEEMNAISDIYKDIYKED
tara:strand:+ start:49 stop:249 length:201 start_codon:yes stop_codon:yes gene_type:complete